MHNYLPKKYYFISKFDKNHIDKLDPFTALVYRNYAADIDKNLIITIKKYCKIKKIKFLLSNDIKLAINLDLDGAYIPSFNSSKKHLGYSYKKHFILLGSAHNIMEIRTKELQRVCAIFLSSVFKDNKNYLGFNRFKLLTLLTKKRSVALGGISNKNLKLIKLTNCFGFAGISIFEQKKGPCLGGLFK